MHFHSKDHHTQQSTRSVARIARRVLYVCLCGLIGCSQYADKPEVNPRAWAPPTAEREWSPPVGARKLVGSAAEVAALSDLPASDRNCRLGLDDLIAFALAENPSTRRAWESAQAAAAAAGKARATYYPILSFHSINSYRRLVESGAQSLGYFENLAKP
jgi:hypothetical protein